MDSVQLKRHQLYLKRKNETVYCLYCDTYLAYYGYSKHNDTQKHINNVANYDRINRALNSG